MGMFHLVRRNLGRKKTRTLFTLLSVVVAFILFTLLGALNRAFTAGLDLAGADRLITMHRVSFIQPMPLSYVNRVSAIEGINEVAHYTWFGAYYQDPKRQFGLFPTEMESLPKVYPEYKVAEDQWQALMSNRTGLLVGRALLEASEWEMGDRVPLGSTIYPQQSGSYAWEFDIVAVFDGVGDGSDELQAFMHYDYFNEGRAFGSDTVGWIISKVADPDQSEAIAKQIDERFANSPTETKTSTEKGWVAGFASQFGNIGLIVQVILACVFFTLILVTGNTMAQAVRERIRELAVLKTLGFSNARILIMVLGESLLIAVIGGAIGILIGMGMIALAKSQMAAFLPGLAVPPNIVVIGLSLAVALGLGAGLLPGLQAMRLRVVEALARR